MPTPLHRHHLLPRRTLELLLPAVLAALFLVVPTHAWADTDEDDQAADDSVEESPTEPFFTDTVDRGHDDAVVSLAAEGVLQGCEEERFCPDEDLTRGQMATMLANVLELEPLAQGPFDDVADNVHEERINALADAGVTVGCEGGAFCPDDTVTREQMATMLVRSFDIPTTDSRHFDDLTQTHGDNVNALADVGIAAGCTDRLPDFCSAAPVLRWEAAMFLARTLDLVERVELEPLEDRRAEQERIDAELEAERKAEEEARRAAEREEEERRAAEQEKAERLAMWDRLAGCESNHNWSANTGNGYYGGLQFLPETWWSVGGQGMPHQASKEEQIYRAERLLEKPWATFSNQWPACSRILGLG